jgi:hypothetical protein
MNSVMAAQPYLLSGAVLDGQGRHFSGGAIGYQGLDDAGNLACVGSVLGGAGTPASGVYTWNGVELRPIYEVELNGAGSSSPAINNRGDVVFRILQPTASNPLRKVISLFTNGELSTIAEYGGELEPGWVIKELSMEPTINEAGDVAFMTYSHNPGVGDRFAIYKYSGGQLMRVLGQGDPAPGGGRFVMNFGPLPRAWIADNGDILFKGYVLGGQYDQSFGLFVVHADGTVEKLEVKGDPLPDGGRVSEYSLGNGTLNAHGDAVFRVRVDESTADSSIFISSRGELVAVMSEGQPSPLGGPYLSLYHPTPEDPGGDGAAEADPPLINGRGQVLFKAEALTSTGKKRLALFLATSQAAIKVVAVGDRMPNGYVVRDLWGYSLNEQGHVLFEGRAQSGTNYIRGTFLARPDLPVITSAKVKAGGDTLSLIIKGRGFIINDAVVEINGTPVGEAEYSTNQLPGDGTTRRLTVSGSQLNELLLPGQVAQITVFNPLTGLRSEPVNVVVPQ